MHSHRKTASSTSAEIAVDRAEQPARHGQRRDREQQPAVQQDLAAGLGLAVDDRQHRDAGARVVVLDQQRERPEVRAASSRRRSRTGRTPTGRGRRRQRPSRPAAGPRPRRRRSRCSASCAASATACRRTRSRAGRPSPAARPVMFTASANSANDSAPERDPEPQRRRAARSAPTAAGAATVRVMRASMSRSM